MDPVTHGLIGAATSQSFAPKEKLRAAALLGAAGGMLPDLDVLIDSSSDPLMQLEFHRQFTHALVFIPVGALIVTGLLWWLVRNQLTFRETYLFSLLGIATAGFVDVFTSYGVQLLWPLTDTRFALNLVSVFDPLFSLGLLLGVGITTYSEKNSYRRAGLGWVGVYLLFALTQQQKAEIAGQKLAVQRNHFTEQLIVKPTIGNSILWSVRYISGGRLYADGVHINPFGNVKAYRGESAELLRWRQQYSDIKGTVLYKDIRRFAQLSDNILVKHPDHPNVIGDGRYSMLPTTIEPLWGIKVDTAKPARHVEFNTYRELSPEIQDTFFNMVLGGKQITRVLK